MTYRIYVQCSDCAHFYSTPFKWHCDAFPDGIPEDILDGSFVHKKPHEGDHGIQFEKKVDMEEHDTPSEQKPVSKIMMQRIMDRSTRYYILPEKHSLNGTLLVKFDGRYSWYSGTGVWTIDPTLFKTHWIDGELDEITPEQAKKVYETMNAERERKKVK